MSGRLVLKLWMVTQIAQTQFGRGRRKEDRMSEYLDPPELHTLTGYARCTDQWKWLATKGIPHRLDGRRVIVSREHIRGWLEGRTVAASNGLNLSRIK